MLRHLVTVAIGLFISAPLSATTFEINDEASSVIGHNMVIYSHAEDTLLDIARRFDLGYGDIVDANPDIDPWLPGDNTRVILPTRFILPDAVREGIVINIAEMRLYYYPKRTGNPPQRVITHPIGIGREGWATPLGKARVTEKRKDPTWTPPESIRQEHLEKGDPLPRVVPAGPDNPLGAYAMRLSMPGYLLHGTNKPFGVGLRVSHGCIRLFPEDIEHLFAVTPSNTPVEIVYQPYKAGARNGQLYLEAHKPQQDIDQRQGNNMTPMVSAILNAQDRLLSDEQWPFVETLVRQNKGIVKRQAESELDIVEDLWFIHSGLSQEAIAKARHAVTTLKLNDLFWPLSAGAQGEILIGPFNSKDEADALASQVSSIAGISVWTVQVSSDAL
ncbi:L,D-transpeptidase family protein [Methylophaga sp. OBS4]|uniref:L,D-transpeptidase family protein n=1 Tax=Methylophaga sp. OBS4 TaxID=2991935 RepID=UPI0022565B46|nr:L,D-transpeptidase family protein [Methylophaga sp. OBS4]MCX4188300.1 L,D-transpeptidase family protein [Methylophaga sp. OBS4]